MSSQPEETRIDQQGDQFVVGVDYYVTLHDYFGRPDRQGGNDVMHRLRRIRREALR